jgi:hypothetical protein
VVALVAVGSLADLALRSGVVGLGGSLFVVALAICVVAAGRLRSAVAITLAGGAVVFGAWLSVRTSAWVLPLDVAATGALLALAVTADHFDGRALITFPDILRRLMRPIPYAFVAPFLVAEAVVGTLRAKPVSATAGDAPPVGARAVRRSRALVVSRGFLIALPVLVVIGLLLGTADGVFASFFLVPLGAFDGEQIALHLLLVGIGAWVLATLLAAGGDDFAPMATARRPIGPVEATVVLCGLTGMYALFAVAQLVAAVGGADHVADTTGLTYAEHARSGFFQLLWASGITLVTLLVLRSATCAVTGRWQRIVTACSVLACLMTLVVVGTAIHRLGLYQDAYGLTMLRLACTLFAWWLGVVFLVVAVRLAGVGAAREWLPMAIVASALIALLVWNVIDPEALVVRTNVDRAVAGQRFDPGYLSTLSDDAVPAMAAALPRLTAEDRDVALAAICVDPPGYGGWAAANRARSGAERARAEVC